MAKIVFILGLILISLVGCNAPENEAPSLGVGNVASTKSVAPVAESFQVDVYQGNLIGEIWDVRAPSNYETNPRVEVLVKDSDGVRNGETYYKVSLDGQINFFYISSLRNSQNKYVSSISAQNLALLPYQTGVEVNAMILKELPFIDLTLKDSKPDLNYRILRLPVYGNLIGTPPLVIYVPGMDYLGVDSFYYEVRDAEGNYTQASVTLNVLPRVRNLFLRTNGNDINAEVDSPFKPFLTPQAVVEKAMALLPSRAKPVHIHVGAGSFGNVSLNSDFGEHIHWYGLGAEISVLGNIVSRGADGDTNENGQDGFDIYISADNTLTFGNIISQGGDGGYPALIDTYGGSPGAIYFKGRAASLYSQPGLGSRQIDLFCIGQSAGKITVEGNSTVSTISANGASCDFPGRGGTVNIEGYVIANIFASGGSGQNSGSAGQVNIKGTVNGSIWANGGDGATGANGGFVNVEGVVHGDIYALGGVGLEGSGGDGGFVKFLQNSKAQDTYVDGGKGESNGGAGGKVYVLESSLGQIFARGGESLDEVNPASQAGNGGEILIMNNSEVGIIDINGGNCHSGLAGDGGQIGIDETSTFDEDSTTFLGGTCAPGADVGEDGQVVIN